MNTIVLRSLLIAVMVLSLCGCGGIGPATVARDRPAYTDAISDSWKRQMLLNMVKMRYADAPVFLDVGSVISQYLLETEVHGSLSWNAFLPTDSQNIGGRGRYAERPTITYQPLTGEKFTRSLMTPIPPAGILSLVQAGWRADLVFRILVQSVNGLHNRVGGRLEARAADPNFYRLTASMLKIQKSLAVGTRIQKTENKKQANVIFIHKKDIAPDIEAEIDTVKKLLGVDPNRRDFKVVYGVLPANDQEIAMLSRSMVEIIVELGSYIEVPETHVAQQRAMPNLAKAADTAADVVPLIRVQSDTEEPADAYVSVRYRDHWFWLDDRDFKSKRMFSFLMFLFSMAETGAPPEKPVLTIPTG